MTDDSAQPTETVADNASPQLHLAYRAASVTWAIGLLELLFSLALAGFLFWAGAQDAAAVHERFFEGRLAITDWLTIHPRLNGFAVTVLLLSALPGVAYVACGFKLKKQSPRAGLIVASLAMVQCFVLAGLLIMRLGSVFAAADPPAMTMSVIAIGTPIAVLFYTARCSWAVWRLRYRP